MNNSLARLLEGMVDALRLNVLPATDGEFARGQLFGVIYLLKNLRLRASWSPAFLGEQLEALEMLRVALELIPGLPLDAPRPPPPPGSRVGVRLDVEELESARDLGDQRVCELIDWQAARGGAADVDRAVHAALDAYLRRQLRYELETSAKPMFAEISLGRETETK